MYVIDVNEQELWSESIVPQSGCLVHWMWLVHMGLPLARKKTAEIQHLIFFGPEKLCES